MSRWAGLALSVFVVGMAGWGFGLLAGFAVYSVAGDTQLWFEPVVVLLVLAAVWTRMPWLAVFLTGTLMWHSLGPLGVGWMYDLLWDSPLILGVLGLAYWYGRMPRLRLGFWESLILAPSYMLAAILLGFILHYWEFTIPLLFIPLPLFYKYGWVEAGRGSLSTALASAGLTVLAVAGLIWLAMMTAVW